MRSVCIYCGSSAGVRPAYGAAARALGRAIAARGLRLVYGGGDVGLMGLVADAALAAGGEVVGVIPRALVERKLAHRALSEQRVVATMHERKALMADLADAFVALPGGCGTLDELFEALTWSQLGFQAKPCALLDVEGYWRPLRVLLDHAVAEGFVGPAQRALLLEDHDPARLLERLAAWKPAVPAAAAPARAGRDLR